MKKGIILLVALMGAISSVIAQEDKSKAVNNEVFVDYDVIAQFPGGEKECFKFLSDNIKYPVECMKKGIQGRVIVSFTINTDGSIEEVKTMRSPDPALSKEAERVIAMMPKWKPAMHGDKAVRSRMSIPVNFRLDVNEPAMRLQLAFGQRRERGLLHVRPAAVAVDIVPARRQRRKVGTLQEGERRPEQRIEFEVFLAF